MYCYFSLPFVINYYLCSRLHAIFETYMKKRLSFVIFHCFKVLDDFSYSLILNDIKTHSSKIYTVPSYLIMATAHFDQENIVARFKQQTRRPWFFEVYRTLYV